MQGVPPRYHAGQPRHAWVEPPFRGNRFVFESATQAAIFMPEMAPTNDCEFISKVFRASGSTPPNTRDSRRSRAVRPYLGNLP